MTGSTHQTARNQGLEVEIVAGAGREPLGGRAPGPELRRAVGGTLETAGPGPGHLALALVSAEEIRALNREHRGNDRPTDVLSFPVDEAGPAPGPRELGDVVVCPEQTDQLIRAAVHGVLHLLGYDHEVDDGRMLTLEDRIVAALE